MSEVNGDGSFSDTTGGYHDVVIEALDAAGNISRLEEAGYIKVQKEFVERIPRTLYRLTDSGREAIQDYRDNMRLVIEQLLA